MCVDNTTPYTNTHTQPTDRPTPTTTTHESLAHDNMHISVCVGAQNHHTQSEAMPPPPAVVKPVPPIPPHGGVCGMRLVEWIDGSGTQANVLPGG